jgi:OOP family OmpA-OmpF porin
MKRLLSASILAASLASGAAFAQVGPYVGASVGQSNYSSDSCIGTCDKTDIGMKLFGGYMFTPNLGAELDYGWYGTAKISAFGVNAEAKADGFSGFLVGQYPIDKFRLFGKLGFARLNTNITANAPGVRFDNNDASFEFAWGLGGTYMIDKNFGIRGEYESRKYTVEGSSDDLGFFSIGVQYHF